ncbi:MAG: DUF2914 domain-containing protein [Candidatus Nomurabacteria bacterium]|nr:DUF2914 domain-containing protein [Candidatus Nomurabacteria bacterium]
MQRLTKGFKNTLAHTSTLIFLAGFIFDAFMLPDIEHPLARYVVLTYLCIISISIMFREWLVSRNTASEAEQKIYSVVTFCISYFSGSALSFVFIYAIRSAHLSVSWPLFLILILCIFANEFVSTHDFRFTLDVGILLIATLFYIIFNVPLFLKVQNDITFGISIGLTVIIFLCYIFILKFSSENAYDNAGRGYALALGVPMFVAMLYFLNVLPAVPLSLKDAGIYHYVERDVSGEYFVKKEIDTRNFSKYLTPVYHLTPSDNGVYFFSAVNAPAELTAPISYVWEYYDTTINKWVSYDEPITFTLEGGRENGYRAYSQKQNITEGLWRVTVKVDNNRIVGRMKFQVVKDSWVDLQEAKL